MTKRKGGEKADRPRIILVRVLKKALYEYRPEESQGAGTRTREQAATRGWSKIEPTYRLTSGPLASDAGLLVPAPRPLLPGPQFLDHEPEFSAGDQGNL